MPETAAKQAKILDDEHRLTTILAVLKTNRERVMVLLSLKAGLRAVEIASLSWAASVKVQEPNVWCSATLIRDAHYRASLPRRFPS